MLNGNPARTVTLTAGRGSEVRFAFRDTTEDVATFRFRVSSGGDADAVEKPLPVRPAYHPRASTAAGSSSGVIRRSSFSVSRSGTTFVLIPPFNSPTSSSDDRCLRRLI